uniref:Transposase n=1 Tax=Ascaris lumbricoides TaxID=6252 RepID=A0A0M3IUA0_ASCLU
AGRTFREKRKKQLQRTAEFNIGVNYAHILVTNVCLIPVSNYRRTKDA